MTSGLKPSWLAGKGSEEETQSMTANRNYETHEGWIRLNIKLTGGVELRAPET